MAASLDAERKTASSNHGGEPAEGGKRVDLEVAGHDLDVGSEFPGQDTDDLAFEPDGHGEGADPSALAG